MNRRNFFKIAPGLLAVKAIAKKLAEPEPPKHIQIGKTWMHYDEYLRMKRFMAQQEAAFWYGTPMTLVTDPVKTAEGYSYQLKPT